MSYPEHFHSIFARNCIVRRIDKAAARQFLDSYHKYGYALCKYRYGIFVERYSGKEMEADSQHPYPVGTLVAVATFSNARHWNKENKEYRSCQWIRYASLPEVRVAGGMGKVLQHFIEEIHPDDIMTYAPLEHYSGEVYRQLGFVEEGIKTFGENRSMKFRLRLNADGKITD